MENMDLRELKETDIWTLYEQGRNYLRLFNTYTETDTNYRFYNGDQWDGVKLKGIEPVQLNFIKPIVRYKVGVIHSNLYAVNYSSQNFENKKFRKTAEDTCEMLNKKASRIWEKDNLDIKGRQITKDAAINSEGLMYVSYSEDTDIVNEVIKKVDVYYGNENDSDIQRQPYILIKQRKPLMEVIEMAKKDKVSEENISLIKADNDTSEESGESAKQEKDSMVTLITKMYKENGKVHFAKATRYCDIKKDTDSGLTFYPLAHMLWEEKEGSSRGESEVKFLIPNQIETNKNFMRSILVAKNTAYPQKVIAVDKVTNPNEANSVGGIIKVKGGTIDDVSKVIHTLQPAQMSTDVEKLRNELISVSRELAGAGDIATGQVNPEDASGKAILAVQQASQQPMTEQLIGFKTFCEDLARVWLDIWTTYSVDGINLEEDRTAEDGTTTTIIKKVPQSVLENLRASAKVDITPKSSYDKFAQESSIENLLQQGLLSIQRLGELKAYVSLLDDDSVMPKQKLEEYIANAEREQQRIAQINMETQAMMQRANQFIDNEPETQAEQINAAEQEIEGEQING